LLLLFPMSLLFQERVSTRVGSETLTKRSLTTKLNQQIWGPEGNYITAKPNRTLWAFSRE